MSFSLRCVQQMVTSILREQQYMFGVKSALMVEKVLLLRNDLVAMLFRLSMTDATITAVDSLMWSDRRVIGKC